MYANIEVVTKSILKLEICYMGNYKKESNQHLPLFYNVCLN